MGDGKSQKFTSSFEEKEEIMDIDIRVVPAQKGKEAKYSFTLIAQKWQDQANLGMIPEGATFRVIGRSPTANENCVQSVTFEQVVTPKK